MADVKYIVHNYSGSNVTHWIGGADYYVTIIPPGTQVYYLGADQVQLGGRLGISDAGYSAALTINTNNVSKEYTIGRLGPSYVRNIPLVETNYIVATANFQDVQVAKEYFHYGWQFGLAVLGVALMVRFIRNLGGHSTEL